MRGGSKPFGLLSITVILAGSVDAQFTWRRTHGGYGPDTGFSVRQTSDGGFVIVGSTGSFGNGGGDMYLLKLDAQGYREWSKTFGGSGADAGYCVRQLPDAGYLIVGTTNSAGAGGYDGMAVRTDALGGMVWEQAYGGADWDLLYAFEPDPNGGFIMVGESYSIGSGDSDGWLVKIDDAGNVVWQLPYGWTSSDHLRDVRPLASGLGYVAVGGTDSLGTEDSWVINVDLNGGMNWSAVTGGDSLDCGLDIVQTQD